MTGPPGKMNPVNRRASMTAAVAVLAAAGAFVAVRATHKTEPRIVLGLGDSVASAWGLGPTLGYPNNPNGFSTVVATRLGYRDYNVSIGKACAAARTTPNPTLCPVTVLTDELDKAKAVLPSEPGIVTLLAGANDIDFLSCIAWALAPIPIPGNPCDGDTFDEHLATLQKSLETIFGRLHDSYRRARIVAVTYFNPLPPAAKDQERPCPVYELLAAARTPLAATTDQLLDKAARALQSEIAGKVTFIVGKLNETIRTAARAGDALIAEPDFVGHDMCAGERGAEAWLYGPDVDVSAAIRIGAIPLPTRRWKFTLPSPCPDQLSEPPEIGLGRPRTVTIGATTVTLAIRMRSNCAPHPTRTGQEAIAKAVLKTLGR